MKFPTFTFGDMANCFEDVIEPRDCHYNFLCLSVQRKPTVEEKKKEPNVLLFIENQMFFYRPFKFERT